MNIDLNTIVSAVAAMSDTGSDHGVVYRFSPSTGGFYPSDIDYPDIPGDLIELTAEEYQSLKERPSGTVLEVQDGVVRIVAAPAPQPTLEQVLGHRSWLLGEAAVRIAPLQDAVDLDDASSEGMEAIPGRAQSHRAAARFPDVHRLAQGPGLIPGRGRAKKRQGE